MLCCQSVILKKSASILSNPTIPRKFLSCSSTASFHRRMHLSKSSMISPQILGSGSITRFGFLITPREIHGSTAVCDSARRSAPLAIMAAPRGLIKILRNYSFYYKLNDYNMVLTLTHYIHFLKRLYICKIYFCP